MESLGMYYLFHGSKFLAVSYIFYRLGKKFHAPNPFWHYMIPIWNYLILCRCTNTSKYYAIGYNILYFLAAVAQIVGQLQNEPALVNIWAALMAMCIILEAEILGAMAVKLNKDWVYGFSGFLAYFPLIFLILAKTEPASSTPPINPLPPANNGDYPVY